MKTTYLFIFLLLILESCALKETPFKSIQDFDVKPSNSAAINKQNLQKAIDWASERGAALYIEPTSEPYPVDGGIILKKNVSLIGANGPVPGGTCHPTEKHPVGSVFKITDHNNPFITVESATQIRGIQFWYPEQPVDDHSKVIAYPPTIQNSKDKSIVGVTLSCLSFFGEYMAMDFNATRENSIALITFEHCYGYPYSGEFIRIKHCYDIPRILHCHVNPALQSQFKGHSSPGIIDAVIAKKSYCYSIEYTDNAQLMDIFCFGVYGGIELGGETYGQLTNFNFDCVAVGIHKHGNQNVNRNWQIAQGSIIANTGEESVKDIHPLIIEGEGHTALSNVEIFSGKNAALTCIPELQSGDYMLVKGDKRLTVTMSGCRMTRYFSENPLTVENNKALIQAIGCVDKYQQPFNRTINGKTD